MGFSDFLGDMIVVLGAKTTQFDRAMAKAETDLQKFELRSKAVTQRTSVLGKQLVRNVTLPIMIASGLAVRNLIQFNQEMTKSISIMGNASSETRKELEDLALEMSNNGIFAAKELAQSYFFLASAGLNVRESMAALPQVQDFAIAGAFDLASATTILTDSMNALGLKTGDTKNDMLQMARVSDVLVKANTLANASTKQFGEALVNRAAAALNQTNKSVEEGTAVLAAFANRGRKGAEAGMALAIVLRDLQTASIKQRDTFQELGLSVFNSRGKMLNMADILGQLEDKLGGMSTEMRRATLLMLGFQDRSVLNIMTLLGASEEVRRFQRNLKDTGITQTVAAKQMESYANQVKQLRNEVTNASLSFAQKLVPALLRISKLVSNMAKAWMAWSDSAKAATVAIAAMAAALGPLLLIAVAVLKTVTALGAVGLSAAVLGWGAAFIVVAAAGAALGVAQNKVIERGLELTGVIVNLDRSTNALHDSIFKNNAAWKETVGQLEKVNQTMKDVQATFAETNAKGLRGSQLRLEFLDAQIERLKIIERQNRKRREFFQADDNAIQESKVAILQAKNATKLEELLLRRKKILEDIRAGEAAQQVVAFGIERDRTMKARLAIMEETKKSFRSMDDLLPKRENALNRLNDRWTELKEKIDEARAKLNQIQNPAEAFGAHKMLTEFRAQSQVRFELAKQRIEEERKLSLRIFLATQLEKTRIQMIQDRKRILETAKTESERAQINKAFQRKQAAFIQDTIKAAISGVKVPDGIGASVQTLESGSLEAFRFQNQITDQDRQIQIDQFKAMKGTEKAVKDLSNAGFNAKNIKIVQF